MCAFGVATFHFITEWLVFGTVKPNRASIGPLVIGCELWMEPSDGSYWCRVDAYPALVLSRSLDARFNGKESLYAMGTNGTGVMANRRLTTSIIWAAADMPRQNGWSFSTTLLEHFHLDIYNNTSSTRAWPLRRPEPSCPGQDGPRKPFQSC